MKGTDFMNNVFCAIVAMVTSIIVTILVVKINRSRSEDVMETANRKKREREREEIERRNWKPEKNKMYLNSFENIPDLKGNDTRKR